MREKGTTLLGAQQYQQALTVYAFQQGQSIAIKYQLLLLPTVVLGEKVKKKNGAKDFGAFGWMSSIIYIPAFPLYIPGSFLSVYTQDSRHTYCDLLFFVLLSFPPPTPLVYTHSYLSTPHLSLYDVHSREWSSFTTIRVIVDGQRRHTPVSRKTISSSSL